MQKTPGVKSPKLYQMLYFQVCVGILLGVLLGHLYPKIAVLMEPLSRGFIKLIKMLIAPIIFTTVVSGIAKMNDIKEVGRIGIKAIIYFEVLTTFALIIGLTVANIFKPGAGLNIDVNSLNPSKIATYTAESANFSATNFILNIIPDTIFSAFTNVEILPVLLISILFGFALLHGGERLKPLITLNDQFSTALFIIVNYIMRLAPLGAFGAMAFTIGNYGIKTLVSLSQILINVYVTCILFVFIVLNIIAKICGISLFKFIKYIKDELFIVLGTSSSEVALPRMLSKLEHLGCGKTVVGLVLPAGYTFNLDGTCIYLTIATLFIAQAFNIHLTLEHQLTIIAILLLTSKGAAAITGGGFIVLAATLSSLHTIPVEGLVLLLGVDRFMSEARALTNIIGNSIATIVVAKLENDFDDNKAKEVLQ
ncbi:MAG: C4-dicarboxylate transporter DctA [Legionellales bacterium RIFCSPHIGHO2_12_FULL_37_14]|nr:MAG: C4-dicarboxylate transporter DctA [Legionellales bacterium RIFCSPHIGHO2_12_FULL_37_14]